MTARVFLTKVQQFFPKAALRSASSRLYSAYCRERETFICYSLESQQWLIETAYDYLSDNELANVVRRLSGSSIQS
ncbi:hypothetical protein [Synechococcus elongatus]|nr:hypothetical protein [Synechococcus elongatus]AJD58978.1 hypothetical protein M744_14205 [Synechococcus elongatus UTEX 2973]MBD2589042.1 hypothetical protein [Synechococcus elongatus FACHB-242]MBD2690137.1 hypothetical protein [Synechococcus elongatus FACHB-1061]MBD2708569.1 hypothetical protein [Synechococcus elongatus PCC 7942 = FACHB-805]UOW72477.1 hypothetical protein PCC7943_pgB036 [Synechococcus elongatus PCC 7943]